jgi:hypothetical protein
MAAYYLPPHDECWKQARGIAEALRNPPPQVIALLARYPLDVSKGILLSPRDLWAQIADELLKPSIAKAA